MKLTAELAALCHRNVVDPGPQDDRYDYFTEDDYSRAIDVLRGSGPNGAIWIFAYGSLIWKPEFPTVDSRPAVADGWHRAFSMELTRYRGTPEQPGYMMCLDRGGSCHGVVLRLNDKDPWSQVRELLYREIGSDEQLSGVRWIDVATPAEPLRALAFYAAPDLLDHYRAGRPLEDVAHGLARACGHWGSGADYLRNTVAHLEAMGIHDAELWALQEMVADEIASLYGVTR